MSGRLISTIFLWPNKLSSICIGFGDDKHWNELRSKKKILVGKAFPRCVPQLKVVFGIERELNIQWIEEINEALPCSPLITIFQPLRPSAYNFVSLQCHFASGFVATDDSHESCGDNRIESKAKPWTHFSLHRPVLGIRTQCNLNLSIGGVSCSPKKLCHLVNLIKIRSSPSVCINAWFGDTKICCGVVHKLSHFDTEKSFLRSTLSTYFGRVFMFKKELKQKFYFDHDTTFCNPLTGLFLGTRSPNSKTSHVVMKRRTKKENDCKQNLLRHIVFTAGEMFVRTLGIRGGGAGDAIPLFICFVLVLVAIKALARLSFPHKNQRKISNLRRQYFIIGLLARRTALLLLFKIMFGKQKKLSFIGLRRISIDLQPFRAFRRWHARKTLNFCSRDILSGYQCLFKQIERKP